MRHIENTPNNLKRIIQEQSTWIRLFDVRSRPNVATSQNAWDGQEGRYATF